VCIVFSLQKMATSSHARYQLSITVLLICSRAWDILGLQGRSHFGNSLRGLTPAPGDVGARLPDCFPPDLPGSLVHSSGGQTSLNSLSGGRSSRRPTSQRSEGMCSDVSQPFTGRPARFFLSIFF